MNVVDPDSGILGGAKGAEPVAPTEPSSTMSMQTDASLNKLARKAPRKVKDVSRSDEPGPQNLKAAIDDLSKGPDRVARQNDLVGMHRSLIENLQKLGAGLSDQAAQREAKKYEQLKAEVDRLAHDINSVDAALRIQLMPEIQAAIEAGLNAQVPSRRPSLWRRLWFALQILGIFAVGVVFSDQIIVAVQAAQVWLTEIMGDFL